MHECAVTSYTRGLLLCANLIFEESVRFVTLGANHWVLLIDDEFFSKHIQ